MASLVSVLLLLLGCGGDKKLPAGDPARPDIVLISVDTLRADHLRSYGHPRETSPFFDALAADGVRYSQARSASPWTLPAHTTMLTGQLPTTHGIIEDKLSLPAEAPFLPELLQGAGYATGGFVGTLYVSRMFKFDRGFDEFNDFGIHTEKANLRGETVASDVVDEALRWWGSLPPEKPVFLFLHVYDVHYTYDPPAPYDTRFDRAPDGKDPKYKNYKHYHKHPLKDEAMEHQRAQYDEAIAYVNDQFARVKAAADAAGRSVRFIITSDHGEEFGERGSWGHAHTLYAEQLHIPLILSGPGVGKGVVSAEDVGSQDIAPTIAAWTGIEGLNPDGRDLSPTWSGGALGPRPFLGETSRFTTNRLSIYDQGLRVEWDLKSGATELFDVKADPAERSALGPERAADRDRLLSLGETLLGAPWEATAAGRVTSSGVLVKNGRQTALDVVPGDRFAVLPLDATVTFTAGGAEQGPFQAMGGTLPGEGAGLAFRGKAGGDAVTHDEATKKLLEDIGYIQREDEDEE
jgi:arylsulfatase